MAKRKKAKAPRQWKRRRGTPFGDYIDVFMPGGTDAVLISAIGQHGRIADQVCLPHQAYVAKIKDVARRLDARTVSIMPIRVGAEVMIDLLDLLPKSRRPKP